MKDPMTIPAPMPVVPTEVVGRFDIDDTDDMSDRMMELFARHGDTYRVIAPSRSAPMLMIHAAEDVRRVLATNRGNYVKGVGFDRVRILLGDGLITSDGELWARQRAMMQPMFHRRIMANFASSIAASNDALLARWEASADQGRPVNVTEGMSAMTLDIVLRSIFGRDLDRLVAETGSNPFDLVAQDSARDLRFAYRFRSLNRLVAGLIERRRHEAEEHHDFVAMLMAARDGGTGAPMSERELINEIMTLIVAGHETTATGLTWTWYLLSQHPDAEARLHAELDALPERHPLELAASGELPVARAVVDEALRLYPPVWVFTRRALEADTLGGFAVPAGTDVILPTYVIHRHPRYWHEPDAFRPERFAPGGEGQGASFAYIPFGAGPRRCLGDGFAIYEMLANLSRFGRRFRLRMVRDQPVTLEARVNLRPAQPMFMTLERR
jgi:enediyne biosynthesis protein E7